MKKILCILMCMLMVSAMLFAGGEGEATKGDEKIILKIGDTTPDRVNGQGAVCEKINKEFMEKYPNVEIVVESYQDQAWQEKVKIYSTANQLPDIMKYWSFPGMMMPLVDAGLIAELDRDTYENFDYIAGALDSNVFNGKLYGVPASADIWVLFANKALFEKAGVELPKTWEDIVDSVDEFAAIGVTPVTTNGKEGWPICELHDNIAQRISGDFSMVDAALDRTGKYTDAAFVEGARYIQNLVKAKVFNSNLTTSDYGDARNMFGQERAAMYMMGPWEMGLATDANFSDSFKENLVAIPFPTIEGGKGLATDTLAWFGGNYLATTTSKNLDVAHDYLEFFAERHGSYSWEMGASFPAQAVESLDKDTVVAKDLLAIASSATSASGTPGLDASDAVFKEDHQDLMRQLCALIITPEEFTKALDASAQRAFDEQ